MGEDSDIDTLSPLDQAIERIARPEPPATSLAVSHEYLRDALRMGEFDNRTYGFGPVQAVYVGPKLLRVSQILLDCLLQFAAKIILFDVDHQQFTVKTIRVAAPAFDHRPHIAAG